MDELVRVASRFMMRDIPFIFGGASVLLSGLYAGILSPQFLDDDLHVDLHVVRIAFGLALAYVVGFAVQDGLNFTPLLNTHAWIKPSRFLGFLEKAFHVWTGKPWAVPPDFDPWPVYWGVYRDLPPEKVAPIERIIGLKHLCACVGSNWAVAGVFIAVKVCLDFWFQLDSLLRDIALFALLLPFSLLLILLSHMQLRFQVMALYEYYVMDDPRRR